MVQNYKKNLTYASKSQEKFSLFSLYKQISISKIFRYLFLVPHLHYLFALILSGTTFILFCLYILTILHIETIIETHIRMSLPKLLFVLKSLLLLQQPVNSIQLVDALMVNRRLVIQCQ